MDRTRSGSSSFDFFQDPLNLPLEIVQTAVVFDNVVGKPPLFFQAHLCVDMFLGFRGAEPVALLQPLPLGVDVARHEDDRPKPFMQLAFEEKRDFINDYGIARRPMLADSLFGERSHARMDDRFEFFPGFGLVKDQRTQFLTIEGLVRLQNLIAKCLDDFFPGFGSRLNDFAREHIGIDDGGAQTL